MMLIGLATTFAARADYAADIQVGLRQLVRELPATTQAATLVALSLVAGGRLWLAGDSGFVAEALGRAGGLMPLNALAKPGDLGKGDVVLLGVLVSPTDLDGAIVQRAREVGATVVTFGGHRADLPGCHWLAVPERVAPGLPTVTPLLVAEMWTFTGELVGALTRLGKMPPMWESILVPGGRERNEPHLKVQWEPGTPPAVPPGVLGRAYLSRLTNCLRRFTRTQAEGVRRFAQMAAATKRAGHTVWFACVGHLPPELPKQPGEPGVFKPLTLEAEKLADEVKPGDLILYLGYYEPLGPWVESAHAAGAKIVTIVSGTPERRAEDMGADLNLSGCWPFGDSVVQVPGYDIKVLPASGVMQAAQYFMLIEALGKALQ
jgi:hypothetical protein